MTQVAAGSVTASMPASRWMTLTEFIDPTAIIEGVLERAVLTTVGPGIGTEGKVLSVSHGRTITTDAETIVARARVLHTTRRMAMCEVTVEDSHGRLLSHATGMAWTQPIQPSPPPPPELVPVRGPTYSTPDPYLRPPPPKPQIYDLTREHGALEVLRRLISGELPPLPITLLTGLRITDASAGATTAMMPATEWLCSSPESVSRGFVATMLAGSLRWAGSTEAPEGKVSMIPSFDAKFLRVVRPDGRELMAKSRVAHRDDELAVVMGEAFDADGNRIALGSATCMWVEPRPSTRAAESERILATVLFTDLVDSTRVADRLGDKGWKTLLDEHNALVRKELANFKGREIKTMGDGFLAIFDSPARAVQCARVIREDVGPLGVEVRAGLHTGECELSGGDIGGMAVNIASRILSEAGAGEIIVSNTVRDLVTGSGLRFSDRGRHALKGVPNEWQLFAVEG